MFRTSKLIDHDLTHEPIRHSGTAGQWNACHAEKQLVVWFLSRHIILLGEECEDENKLDALLAVQPPKRSKGARILVSKVCPCCREFIEKVNQAFGLTLEAADCSAKGEAS